jgi:2C-methyl-D-erythritol 2,4-cyclodiphosphate synthase
MHCSFVHTQKTFASRTKIMVKKFLRIMKNKNFFLYNLNNEVYHEKDKISKQDMIISMMKIINKDK